MFLKVSIEGPSHPWWSSARGDTGWIEKTPGYRQLKVTVNWSCSYHLLSRAPDLMVSCLWTQTQLPESLAGRVYQRERMLSPNQNQGLRTNSQDGRTFFSGFIGDLQQSLLSEGADLERTANSLFCEAGSNSQLTGMMPVFHCVVLLLTTK